MFNSLGSGEVLIIAVVVMILFGSKRLPEFTRSLGESAKEFRKGLKEEADKKPSSAPPEDIK